MNPVTATATAAANTQPTGQPNSGSSSTANKGILGPDDFLKLMMVQLKSQDPLNPSDPSQYLSQLAQFTSVQQAQETAQAAQTSAAEQTKAAALGLLGHSISYVDANGNTQSGTVQKVDLTSSTPTLTVSGVSGVDVASVSNVS